MQILILTAVSGAIFTIIAGTLSHFIYDWFGNSFTAILGAVNESTWEHLKLIFWPIVIFGIIEYFIYGKSIKGFIAIKVLSILIGMAAIVIIFYTYTGILGYSILAVDILSFIIGTIAAYGFSYFMLKNSNNLFSSNSSDIIAFLFLMLIIAVFIIFTYIPPKIGLFLDPVTKSYGIKY